MPKIMELDVKDFQTIQKKLEESNKKLLKQGEEIKRLKETVESTRIVVEDLDTQVSIVINKHVSIKKNNLKGFSLSKRKTTGNKEYWYAGKEIDGKRKWVYIGLDKSVAPQKIEAWLKENTPKKVKKTPPPSPPKKKPPPKKKVSPTPPKVLPYTQKEFLRYLKEKKDFDKTITALDKGWKELSLKRGSVKEAEALYKSYQTSTKLFIDKQKNPFLKDAARIESLMALNGPSRIMDGKLWNKTTMEAPGMYRVGQIIQHYPKRENLEPFFEVLRIGKPSIKSREQYMRALIEEIEWRVNLQI